jgi:ABC-type Na+ efflux pump permease subunit
MTTLGKTLIVAGVLIAAAGLVVMLLGRTGIPLGRLPGDFLYRGKRTTFYFPLATSLLLSVLLSLAFYVIGRMRR